MSLFFEIFRPQLKSNFNLTSARLEVPNDALKATLGMLQRFGFFESAVFWYGAREGNGSGKVKMVVAPKQTMNSGNYHVNPKNFSEMVDTLEDESWRLLAQIHSHPGILINHSTYDDKMVVSKRALSLVFPSYGNWNGKWPAGVGVHEWQNNFWHLLSKSQARKRIFLSSKDSIISVDLRK